MFWPVLAGCEPGWFPEHTVFSIGKINSLIFPVMHVDQHLAPGPHRFLKSQIPAHLHTCAHS